MAWTDKTWAFQEGVESSEMNQLRDNFRLVGPHLIARKTSDETDSVGTLQDDDVLFTPSIPASEVWQLEWWILAVATSSGTFQARVTFPSGAFTGTSYGLTNNLMMSATTSPTNTVTPDINNNAAGQLWKASGVFTNGATPGAVTLQWARQTSGSAVFKANSTLWGVQLA